MPILHAIVLGLVQGLSEFLPISSSGHLTLVPELFGWHELTRHPHLNKTFDVALHLGTLVAAVWYFRRELARYVAAGWHTHLECLPDAVDGRHTPWRAERESELSTLYADVPRA